MPDASYWDVHDAACANGETTYQDPETGYVVFTRIGLAMREKCCGAGCRHCPFEHANVSVEKRARRIQQAAWLSEIRPRHDYDITLLFWSGGKDSFLAYRALARESSVPIVLLTTFDARSRVIPHQEFAIDVVVEQAAHLGLPLIGVPVHPGVDYLDHIAAALELVPQSKRLSFGDLHLEHIRNWREESFAADPRTKAIELCFPLWKADYNDLLTDLEASDATSVISAITAEMPGISIGDRFDKSLIERLPQEVDPFGENGEFHTRIAFEGG